MMSRLALALVVALVAAMGAAATVAFGDDTLREGMGVTGGVSAGQGYELSGKGDFALVPIPGGGRLNGTRGEFTLAMRDPSQLDDAELAQARLELVRWSHLHLLGIERDKRLGEDVGVELLGLYMPLRLAGKLGDKSWALAHLGGNLGVRHYDRAFCGKFNGTGGTFGATARLDELVALGDRLALRFFQQADYTAFGGATDAGQYADFRHSLAVQAGAGLYLDVTPQAPYRKVPRTNPATGAVTYRKAKNQGKRARWAIVEAGGELHVFDGFSDVERDGYVRTGLSYEY